MANQRYQEHRLLGWTRVDMLLALYDAALMKLEQATQALEEGNPATSRQRGLEALRLVAQLDAGLVEEYGEVTENLKKLFHFANRRILAGNKEGIEDAHRILQKLHEAFADIREEAAELEHKGVIPPLEEIDSCDRTV